MFEIWGFIHLLIAGMFMAYMDKKLREKHGHSENAVAIFLAGLVWPIFLIIAIVSHHRQSSQRRSVR